MAASEKEVSLSAEYAPDDKRQFRALLAITGIEPERIERLVEEEVDDEGPDN